MPSLQSYIFRMIAKGIRFRMNSITSIPKLRAFSEKISRPLPLPGGVTLDQCNLDGIPLEWIIQSGPVSKSAILYLHGGAWVLGLYNTHRVLASSIGKASGSRVLAVDYRLVPEYPYPASLNDCLAAYRKLLNDGIEPNRIVIAGDSAGSNLALAVLFTVTYPQSTADISRSGRYRHRRCL